MTNVAHSDLDEAELIRRAKGGDAAAFGELVHRHQRAALRLATVVLGSAEGAEDVTQESFVKAYVALGRFREGAAFRPWLYRIVANTARNQRRSAGRRAALALKASASSEIAVPAPEEPLPREQLVLALNRMPEPDRLVLALRYFEDLSEMEMAQALHVRPGTVKSRLSRAFARMRAELSKEGIDAF
jgi:RNA polymerase sigma-70 factor (ECF subfamily)